MMKTILNIINVNGGKMFIYHNSIHMSGVLFIQEILLQNNIIGEYDNSTSNTICSICGKPRKDHSQEQLGGGIMQDDLDSTNLSAIETSDIITGGGTKDNDLIIKHNLTTNSYEVYLKSNNKLFNCDPVLEYKICDNFLIIQWVFVNIKNTSDEIINVIQKLGKDKLNKI